MVAIQQVQGHVEAQDAEKVMTATAQQRLVLDAELEVLNNAVARALGARRQWMDTHMADYARWLIGTELVEIRTGRSLGKITGYFRYWQHLSVLSDTCMQIEYTFKTPLEQTDNTFNFLSTNNEYNLCAESREEYERRQQGRSR